MIILLAACSPTAGQASADPADANTNQASVDQAANAPQEGNSAEEVLLQSGSCSGETPKPFLPRYARLQHDPQWMDWPSRVANPEWPKGFSDDWYPETVQLRIRPKGGDGRLNYSRAWLEYLRDLQPNDESAIFIARIANGLFNRGNEYIPILDLDELTQEPTAESISSGGNVVKIVEKKGGSGRIEMLFNQDNPPDPDEINYQATPWLVTKFTSVSYDGDLGNVGGIDVYFPLLARQKEGYWVALERIEYFPLVPYCATIEEALPVYDQSKTTSLKRGTLSSGQQVEISAYLPQGSDVWGKVQEGWILLVYQDDTLPVYPTSWDMDTRPPIIFPDD